MKDKAADAQDIPPPALGRMPGWARVLISRANYHTPVPGFSEQDMMAVWERCEGRCAVSGLPFRADVIGNGRAKRPFAPSLDRIDPARGYQPDNVRLVCVIANFAMNAWGQEPLRELAAAIVAKEQAERRDSADRDWYARQDARIGEAEHRLATLTGVERARQKARIAALKRARTLGPAGLKAAAEKAAQAGTSA